MTKQSIRFMEKNSKTQKQSLKQYNRQQISRLKKAERLLERQETKLRETKNKLWGARGGGGVGGGGGKAGGWQ